MGKTLSAFILLVAVGALLLLSGWEAKPAPEQPVEYAVWSPYWTVQPGFTSTMEMKNNRAKETLRVVVSLYFAGGEEYHLDPISLGPPRVQSQWCLPDRWAVAGESNLAYWNVQHNPADFHIL